MIWTLVMACQKELAPPPDFSAGADCGVVIHASSASLEVEPSLTVAAVGDTLVYTPWNPDSTTGQSVTTTDARTTLQQPLGEIPIEGSWHPWWTEAQGDRLWVGDYDMSNDGWSRLRVYDLSRPEQPQELAVHELPHWPDARMVDAGDQILQPADDKLLAFDALTGEALGEVQGLSGAAVAAWSEGVLGVEGDGVESSLVQYAWEDGALVRVGAGVLPSFHAGAVTATTEGPIAWVQQEEGAAVHVSRWELAEGGPVLTATWTGESLDELPPVAQANGIVYVSHTLENDHTELQALDAETLEEVGRWEWDFWFTDGALGDDGRYWLEGSTGLEELWIGAISFDFSSCR